MATKTSSRALQKELRPFSTAQLHTFSITSYKGGQENGSWNQSCDGRNWEKGFVGESAKGWLVSERGQGRLWASLSLPPVSSGKIPRLKTMTSH